MATRNKSQEYVKVEWDPEYNGGDYSGVGNFALIPVCDDVPAAFEKQTGHPRVHIVHYSEDELHDGDGNLLDE